MDTRFDVVILGAGIAGLLLASELSATKKVLLLETRKDLQLTKYWVTSADCLLHNPELAAFVDHRFASMDFYDAYKENYRLTGDYILWHTENLVNYLQQKIEKNNAKLIFDQRFCGYKTKAKQVEVFANDQCYTAKLMIDCMGYSSPLVLAKDVVRIKGYYLLYGSKLRLNGPMEPICLSNVILDKRPKYFEAFPTSGGEAFATMIYPAKNLSDMKGLAADFKFIINKSRHAKHFDTNAPVSRLWGIVPVGDVRKKAFERIFFFGESAQNNPAATGTCLTRLLNNFKVIAEFLDKKIEQDDLSEKSLSSSPVVLNEFVKKLQLYAYKDILYANSDRFSKYISIIDKVDHNLINKFIFGDLTLKDITASTQLFSLIKPRNFIYTRSLIRSLP